MIYIAFHVSYITCLNIYPIPDETKDRYKARDSSFLFPGLVNGALHICYVGLLYVKVQHSVTIVAHLLVCHKLSGARGSCSGSRKVFSSSNECFQFT
jgi:hypothetical protein